MLTLRFLWYNLSVKVQVCVHILIGHTRRNLRFFSPAFRILWVVNINQIFLWFSTKHCCRELLALLQKQVINQLSCCSCKGIKWNKHQIYFFLLRLCPHFCKYFAKLIFSCMFWPLVQTQMTFSVNENRFFFFQSTSKVHFLKLWFLCILVYVLNGVFMDTMMSHLHAHCCCL